MPSAIDQLQRDIVEATFDNARAWYGPDRCDLIGPIVNEGGGAGDTVTNGTILTGIECFIQEISGASAQTVIGGESYVSSHRIEVKRRPETLAITPQYKLRVYPRDGIGERYFENTIQAAESFAPLVVLKAAFVQQGFRQ